MYLGVWARNDPHARVSACSASTSTPTTPLHVPPNCQTRVNPRDQLIGWTTHQRQGNLHLVVNNARFLILPWIHCKNLASRILAVVSRRLPDDWLLWISSMGDN